MMFPDSLPPLQKGEQNYSLMWNYSLDQRHWSDMSLINSSSVKVVGFFLRLKPRQHKRKRKERSS